LFLDWRDYCFSCISGIFQEDKNYNFGFNTEMRKDFFGVTKNNADSFGKKEATICLRNR